MAGLESITEARKRGASDDAILAAIERDNPERAGVIKTARGRGAQSSAIVDEIIKQKSAAPAVAPAATQPPVPAVPKQRVKVTEAGIVPVTEEEPVVPAVPAVEPVAPEKPAGGIFAALERLEPREPGFGEKPTGIAERARLSFGSPTEQASRVEPRGFLAGGLAEIPRDIADVIGPSTREAGFLGGIAAGAAGGAAVGSVVPGIGTVAGGFIGGVLGAVGGTAVGEFFRQKIGEALGVQADITPGEQRRQIGVEAILGGTAQAVAPVVGAALKPVLRIGGKALTSAAAKTAPVRRFFGEAAKDVVSKMTSVDKEAIDELIKQSARKTGREAIEAGASGTGSRVVIAQRISVVARKVKAATNKAFGETLSEIEKKYPKPRPQVVQSFKEQIVAGFRKEAEARGVKFAGNRIAEVPARVAEKASGAEGNIRQAWDLIRRHKDFSIRGISSLKEDLNALSKFGDLRRAIPLVNELSGRVGRWIGAKDAKGVIRGAFPELAELRAKSSFYRHVLENVDVLFNTSKGGVKSVRAAARNLAAIFKTDNELYLQAIKDLEDLAVKEGVLKTKTMVPEIVGTLFSRESPGILRTSIAAGAVGTSVYAGILSPAFLLLLPFFSPRFVQSVLRRAGASSEFTREFVQGLVDVAARPAAQQAKAAAGKLGILETLRSGAKSEPEGEMPQFTTP